LGRHKKHINLSFDEWNVWFQSDHAAAPERDWQAAQPLIEDTYSVTDAVVVGNLLMSLLRRADRARADLARTRHCDPRRGAAARRSRRVAR
jgi:alpha-L-arabinofuranosidase